QMAILGIRSQRIGGEVHLQQLAMHLGVLAIRVDLLAQHSQRITAIQMPRRMLQEGVFAREMVALPGIAGARGMRIGGVPAREEENEEHHADTANEQDSGASTRPKETPGCDAWLAQALDEDHHE